MKNKFVDFVCSIKSWVFKLLATILIFGTMMIGLAYTDHDLFSIRTISGILFATFGYSIALILALIRNSKGIKD
jgi:hypothetical protein